MNSPFHVLGIALVVEGMGKGARLAFRYPVTAPSRVDENSQEKQEHEEELNDLFFTLPPRVMAKLFRPKKPLCGQPMTVSVGGTVFCCRAVLLEDDDNDITDLVLFSVVVALEPLTVTSAIPISGWFDAEALASSEQNEGSKETSTSGRLASASFRSIRRVHISMGRLCRALEREERRCQYVSTQSSLFLKLRKDLGLSDDGAKADAATAAAAAATSTSNNPATTTKSGSSAASNATNAAPSDTAKKGRHRRLGSGSLIVSNIVDQVSGGDHQPGTETTSTQNLLNYQGREQEAVEVMLASQAHHDDSDSEKKQADSGAAKPLNGNLARELAQTFHALSRNDHLYAPTSMGLLSGQDGIVYINRHVAVPIESISSASVTFSSVTTDATTLPSRLSVMMDSKPVIRPYHTLLFPHASPGECLENLVMASSTPLSSKTAPKKLEQLLLMVNPHKSLSEISVDAGMPLAWALELAGYLVGHRICVLSPVLGRSSRLACCHDAVPKKLQALSLSFCQKFGPNLSIFLVVSVLTSHGATLGELMSRVSLSLDDDEDETIALMGDRIVSSLGQQQQQHHAAKMASPGLIEKSVGAAGSPKLRPIDPGVVRAQDVEEVVYSMAVWLRAHHVIVDLKDYLVGVKPTEDSSGNEAVADKNKTNPEAPDAAISESVTSNNSLMERERIARWDHNIEETLYNELLEAGCLNGNVSTVALCWKFALDGRRLHRFRQWGFRHGVLRIVTRIPAAGDDWGAV